MIDKNFLELLICPASGKALSPHENQLISSDQSSAYPLIGDIPWLLPNPQFSIADWLVKLQHFRQILSSEIQELETAIQYTQGNTQERLKRLRLGKIQFVNCVSELLSPLLQHQPADPAIYDALNDKAPSTQNLLSYEANLYRDWAWGDDENQQTAQIIKNQISLQNPKNCLVLGAGAGRLALDIHQHIKPKLTIASDINPLLVLAADKLLNSGELTIQEFPLHPRRAEWVAVEHQLKSPIKRPVKLSLLV